MNINEISQAVQAAHADRISLMIWGAPGLGKSAAVAQAAERMKIGFIDLRLPLLEPVDLRGLPQIIKGVACWSRPSFFPTSGEGVLFLDELPQAVPSMQAAGSQLILYPHKIGDYTLPVGWSVCAAGNRLSDRAATNAMPTHIANRFVHLYAEVSVPAWIEWALQNSIDIRTIAFVKWKNNLLHAFDPQAKVQAFPSPRSWEFVSKLLGQKIPPALLSPMIRGAIGEGAASEFMAFLQVFDKLPSLDAIRMNPTTAPIPTEMSVLYAVVTSLASGATADNIGNVAIYFNRITTEAQRPEFSVIAMKEISLLDDARVGKKKVCNTRAWIEWASKHSNMI